MAAHWEEGQGVRGAYGTLVHHGGVALHYVWRKTSGRCSLAALSLRSAA